MSLDFLKKILITFILGGLTTLLCSTVNAQGSIDCFKNIQLDKTSVNTHGTFTCQFDYDPSSGMSGSHLNCAILKNGQVVIESNNPSDPGYGVGCLYNRSENNTTLFNCKAPGAADTYEVVGYLDPNNNDNETTPASCADRDVKTTIQVTGGGGGLTPQPTNATSPCFSNMTIPQTVSPGGTFQCSYNFNSPSDGARLQCAISKNEQIVPGVPCTYVSTQNGTVTFNCTAPTTADTYQVIGSTWDPTLASTCGSIRANLQVSTSGGSGSCPGGEPDLKACTGYDILAMADRVYQLTNDATLRDRIIQKFKQACAYLCNGAGTPSPTPATSVTPPPAISCVPGGTTGTHTVIQQLLSRFSNTSQLYQSSVQKCLNNRGIYEQAVAGTGLPWQVLAGIHFVEGNCNLNQSCISGRQIRAVEPDEGSYCTSHRNDPRSSIPISGGCGFDTLLRSCMRATDKYIAKIGHPPNSFVEIVLGLSNYNGGGNRNCGRTPYSPCPPEFTGEDDPYAMNFFYPDRTMFLRYCADHTLCRPPKVFQRPGAATMIGWVAKAAGNTGSTNICPTSAPTAAPTTTSPVTPTSSSLASPTPSPTPSGPRTRHTVLQEQTSKMNITVNTSLRILEAKFGIAQHPSWDLATAPVLHQSFFVYEILKKYADNPQNGIIDSKNSDDIKVFYDEKNDFTDIARFDSSSPQFTEEAAAASSPHKTKSKTAITGIYNILIAKQKVRARHIILSNVLQTFFVQGLTKLDVTQAPSDLKFEEWIHEIIHLGGPFVKTVYDNPSSSAGQFVAAGVSFSKMTEYYDYILQRFRIGESFLDQRFFSKPGDTTKQFIQDHGGSGVLRTTDEWIAILSAEALNANNISVFDSYPQNIKDIVLYTLDFVINGNNPTGNFSRSDFISIRNRLALVKQNYLR